ncbi:MAG: acetyl-CoA carboxylase biotin carboxylase subunit [Alphaproteobacteria bacterium]|nr:acetyl-CoA carboxylase biotin carboxylase subunit [Alphaproteobacteria bacterium]MCB9690372.1 acetyl-CoA carboxylase biotin carboxylase subunit [Alphaproteobacteria bacterium]
MNVRPFKRVLIANRGEIAVRILRGCHERGLEVVAVYSEADADALHVRQADQAVCIGPAASSESYLVGERILEVARQTGADAIHPGYGFLSENAGFAQAVIDAGLVWIGPPPSSISAMGSKTAARQHMDSAGVPVVPGTLEPVADPDEALRIGLGIGFPLMLKAAAGGGGKGMRLVHSAEELPDALASARSEARKSFGDDAVYLERAIIGPRHVEIQVLADAHGNVVHLFERDCSVQRRHQKVVEEAPCPILPPETRAAMGEVAVRAAKAVDYVGAGTCEFLLGADGAFYFLEMNTRLQVEHPITEMITGVDLLQAQLRVAAGEPLWFTQDDLEIHGHAIECRIYAEDARAGFRPAPGPLHRYREPTGPWVRCDSGVTEGMAIPVHYDPMVAKLVVWGATRTEAIQRAREALRNYRLVGTPTSIPFFLAIFEDADFLAGNYTTAFIRPEWLADRLEPAESTVDAALLASVIARFEADRSKRVEAAPGTATSPWKRAARWHEGARGWA